LARYQRAEAAWGKGQYQAAIRDYEVVVKLAPGVFGNISKDHGALLSNLAMLYDQTAQYDKALPLHQQSVKIRNALYPKGHLELAIGYNNLGEHFRHRGKYQQAADAYRDSIRVKEKLGLATQSTMGISLNNLGLACRAMAEYAQAREPLERALAIMEKAAGKDHYQTAIVLDNLGQLEGEQGRFGEGVVKISRAIGILEKSGNGARFDLAISLNNLAFCQRQLGNDKVAEAHYSRALELFKAVVGTDHPSYAQTLENLGTVYQHQGQYAAAERLFTQALDIRQRKLPQDHPDIFQSLNDIAIVQGLRGKDAESTRALQQLVEQQVAVGRGSHPHTAVATTTLAVRLLLDGHPVEASPYVERSLKSHLENLGAEHIDTGRSYGLQSLVHSGRGEWTQAADSADTSRRILRRHARQALPSMSEVEQLRFLSQEYAADLDASLSLGLFRRDDPHTAQLSAGWLLNGKGVIHATLVERLTLEKERSNPAVRQQVDQLKNLRDQIAGVTYADPSKAGVLGATGLARLIDEERKLSRELSVVLKRPDLADPWVELAAVREALPADSVLIDIARFRHRDFGKQRASEWWGPARYAAWVIPPTGRGEIRIVDLGDAVALEDAVQKVRTAIEVTTTGTPVNRETNSSPKSATQATPSLLQEKGERAAVDALREPLSHLGDLLWKPLAPHVGDAKSLIISPDGTLWLAPFGALPIEDRFLIEDFAIQYAVSGRDLVFPVSAPSDLSAPVIFADPNFDLPPEQVSLSANTAPRGQLGSAGTRAVLSKGRLPQVGRLPGTLAEALAVAPNIKTYTGTMPITYKDQDALESVFKRLQHPKLAMVGTHGFAFADQPSAGVPATDPGTAVQPIENPLLRCGLLFAGCNPRNLGQTGNGDDGVLTGLEIVSIDFRGTPLVVLSACDTGIGDVRNGEGVAGLRQAFQLAGAQTVVATLWQIPDIESARIMNDLFTNLAEGQSRSNALRDAQLKRIAARREKYGAAHPYFWAAFTLTGM